jgi:hypothetical protein
MFSAKTEIKCSQHWLRLEAGNIKAGGGPQTGFRAILYGSRPRMIKRGENNPQQALAKITRLHAVHLPLY